MPDDNRPNWLALLIDREIEARWAEANAIAADIRSQHPGGDPDLLVNELISSKARVAAFVGVGTGALQAIPAIGQALSFGAVLPEAFYLARVQIDIALVVALLYQPLTKEEAKGIIVTCLVLALGADFIKANVIQAATKLTREVVEKVIARMGEKQLVVLLQRIGIEASKAGILKKVPLVGVPLNATLNYAQIEGFGWVVKKFMSPSFVMCGGCGAQTGRLNKFCPECGASIT
ncbi:MAG: hypothetical protein AB7K71_17115 [Polyangiaceae bacterium]